MKWLRNLFFKSPLLTGFVAFILTLSFGMFLSLKDYQIHQIEEVERVRQVGSLIQDKIEGIIMTANSTVNILAFLVKTERINGDFEEIGESIIDNISIIDQIQVLDSGVITATYPLQGNESVIGFDILADPYARTEAIYAIQKKALVFAGPLKLKQNGEALIGRLPLFEDNQFTGFAAVLIDWNKFKKQVFNSDHYLLDEFLIDLFKINPIDRESVSLLKTDFSLADGPDDEIIIPEGNWVLRIQLLNSTAWIAILPKTIFRMIAAFLMWFLIFRLAQQPHILNKKVVETTKELQLSNQRFNLAIQATSEIIWDWDLLNDVTFRSENFEKLLGYTPSEETQHSGFWKSLIHPEDINEVENYMEKTFKGKEEKWTQEFRIRKADGEYIYIIDKGLIIRNELGSPIRMIGSTQDITFRKKAEDEIAQQKERISNVIEGTHAGTWEWNIQSGEAVYNRIWAEIIGYSLEELEPISMDTWEKFCHPEDLIEANKILHLHLTGKLENYEAECRIRHKNGNWVWVLDKGKVLSWTIDGKPLMMFGTHIDITEKKKQQDEVKIANMRLQSVNEELKSFTSIASHDMKEPLRMISSFLSLLEKKYKPILDDKGLQYIQFAVDGAKRLSALIEDLMQYAKIGFDPELIAPINLNVLLEEVIALNQPLIDQQNVVVVKESLPLVMGISTPIKTVFLNLISNAIKYKQKGRDLIIKISAEILKEHVVITIEDNGIGIEQEYFEKIFELFSRLHAKDNYTGVGLGLAICKKIITQHGGEIWLESTPDIGSKFHFTLSKYEDATN